jgi:hypothetical protein
LHRFFAALLNLLDHRGVKAHLQIEGAEQKTEEDDFDA